MLTRHDPWTPIRQLREEIDRAFGDALSGSEDNSNVVTSGWMPAVDIREEAERFVLCADVPGVEPQRIDITMENGVLTIKGERNFDTDGRNGYRRVERRHGTFYRRFSLPDTADAEKISATGKNGVLEVVIPKKASVKPKRIKIAH